MIDKYLVNKRKNSDEIRQVQGGTAVDKKKKNTYWSFITTEPVC